MSEKLNDSQILTSVRSAKKAADQYTPERNTVDQTVMDYYNSEPWNEVEGRSKVKSTDVYDTIEAPLPDLVGMFLSARQPMRFAAEDDDDQASVEEAEQKTKYINKLIKRQPNAYRMYSSWIKAALMKKVSVLTYEYVESEKVDEIEYEGLTLEEQIAKIQELDSGDYEWSVKKEKDNDDGTKDFVIRTVKQVKEHIVRPVKSDCFFVSKGATDKDDAEIIGHSELIRRGDLLARDYSKNQVERLNPASGQGNRLYTGEGSQVVNRASDMIEVTYAIVWLDVDGDGIAERVRVIYSGEELLDKYPFDHANYAIASCNLMPDDIIGKSLGEVTLSTEDVKSTLMRGMLDNMYNVNTGRVVVNTAQETNVDDLLTNRHRGIVRTKGDPRMAVAALETPYVADKTLNVIQYMDFAKSQRTGMLMASQGLTMDSLKEETATRFEGIQSEGDKKVKLIGRNIAETGFRDLFEGLAWLVSHTQVDKEQAKRMGVDPKAWKYDHRCVAEVGLGSGAEAEQSQALMAVYSIQKELLGAQSPLVDWVKVYNTLEKALKSLGYSQTATFFNNPEVPEEMTQQTIEMLNQQLEMAMNKIEEQANNPLAEAEQIRAQAKLMEVQIKEEGNQMDKQIELAKLAQDQQQFNETLREEQRQFNATLRAEIMSMMRQVQGRGV